ncbi:MAG: hypothetical protein UIM53_08710 [Acutalibacteraceae bacterium]|nr:hypothetical protein [Acutalibacteraceae bacterium]
MWKKPMVKEPEFSSKAFEELEKNQSSDITGGGFWGVGTCAAVGIACNTRKGGVCFGVCYVAGYRA